LFRGGGESEIGERAHLGRHHPVGARRALLVKHEVHAVAVGQIEREGVVEIFFLEEDLALGVGEERGVEAQRLLRRERVLGDDGESAVFPDERPGAGGQVQVAPPKRAVALSNSPSLASSVSSLMAVTDSNGKLARSRRRKATRRPTGRPPRPGFPGWRTGRWRAGRRGFAHGLAGESLQHLDVVDDAAVDQQLGEFHQVGLGAEGTKNGLALRAGKKALVDA